MTSETAIMQQIRLESYRRGTPLLRNNSGASVDQSGRLIRFGLGNDSAKLNDVFKSHDLIGIRPVTVTQAMVGRIIGQFMSVEVKPPGWVFRTSDKRAVAQQAFADWVIKNGGFAQFATSIEDVTIWQN